MLICLLGARWNLSRLFTFACLLVLLAQLPTGLTVDSTVSPPLQDVPFLVNRTSPSDNGTRHPQCVTEVIDETLFYYSLPYRIFAGALVVPITICAIFGNILVIYVIKHYRSLRVTGNVFLASLAVADVGVSTLAMTFYGLQLIQGRWIFGAVS